MTKLTGINPEEDIKRFEHILRGQVEFEVERYINNALHPTIKSIVKRVATDAVKNWTQHIKLELDASTYSTRIQINFVENVVKTVMKESDIKIEVQQ